MEEPKRKRPLILPLIILCGILLGVIVSFSIGDDAMTTHQLGRIVMRVVRMILGSM